MANLLELFDNVVEFQNYNGVPLAAGKMYVYALGRTRLMDTWSDIDGESLNPNPIILDDLGQCHCYVSDSFDYTIVVCDQFDNEIFSVDKYLLSKGEHSHADVAVAPSEHIGVSSYHVGEVTVYVPYLTGEVGKVYEGIDPIVVNNDVNRISANHIPLGVQSPLYFAEDSETACILGCSAQTEIPAELSGKWDNAADTVIANSAQWAEGTEYEAGSYIDITNNTISVVNLPTSADVQNIVDVATSGLMPSGDYLTKESADTLYAPTGNYLTGLPDDLVYTADITGLATTAQLDEKLDKADSANFYPMEGNPSGFLTEHQSLDDYATKQWVEDKGYLTGVDIPESATWNATTQTVSANSAQWAGGTANPQIPVTGINGIKISESGDKVVFEVSADYATQDWVTGQGYLTAVPESALSGFIKNRAGNLSAELASNGFSASAMGQGYIRLGTFDGSNNFAVIDASGGPHNKIAYGSTIEVSSQIGPKHMQIGGNGSNPGIHITAQSNYSVDIDAYGASAKDSYGNVKWQIADKYWTMYPSQNTSLPLFFSVSNGEYSAQNPFMSANPLGMGLYDSNPSANNIRITPSTVVMQKKDGDNLYSATLSPRTGLNVYQSINGSATESVVIDANAGVTLNNRNGNITLTGALQKSEISVSDNKITAIAGTAIAQPDLTGYLTTADSANFYTTANESGFITAVPDTYLQNTDLSTTDGKVTAISGIPLSAGGDVPEGVMVESAVEYNAVNEISGYNGSAIAQYGAEKQWLVHDDTLVHAANSAQYALGVNLSAVAQLLGVDETVLWSGAYSTGTTSITFAENLSNFERIKVQWQHNTSPRRIWQEYPNDTYEFFCTLGRSDSNATRTIFEAWWANNSGASMSKNFCRWNWMGNGSTDNTWTEANELVPIKVIGIGRKQ